MTLGLASFLSHFSWLGKHQSPARPNKIIHHCLLPGTSSVHSRSLAWPYSSREEWFPQGPSRRAKPQSWTPCTSFRHTPVCSGTHTGTRSNTHYAHTYTHMHAMHMHTDTQKHTYVCTYTHTLKKCAFLLPALWMVPSYSNMPIPWQLAVGGSTSRGQMQHPAPCRAFYCFGQNCSKEQNLGAENLIHSEDGK